MLRYAVCFLGVIVVFKDMWHICRSDRGLFPLPTLGLVPDWSGNQQCVLLVWQRDLISLTTPLPQDKGWVIAQYSPVEKTTLLSSGKA